MSKAFFTPSERERVLRQIVAEFKTDERIVGVVLVGSGVVGFEDAFSDIDVVAVIDPDCPTERVFRERIRRLLQALLVIHRFEVSYGPESFLAGLLISGFLEVDLGFVSLAELTARKARWQVLYDRTGRIDAQLQASWEAREEPDPRAMGRQWQDSIWHYVVQAVVGVRREQYWRAVHNLEEVRNRALGLAGLRRGLTVSHFRQIDRLPEVLREEFERTLVKALTAEEILRALRVTVRCFFREMRSLAGEEDSETAIKLEAAMLRLIEG